MSNYSSFDASRRETEYLKARLARFEASDQKIEAQGATELITALFKSYLRDAPEGGWMDRYDAEGRQTAKDIPASTFYHLFAAFAEADRILLSEEAS